MKTTKNLLIVLLIADLLHYFIFRANPNYSEITEAFYETLNMSLIKWVLLILAILGLQLKNKYSLILSLIASFGMIIFSIYSGPLFRIYNLYSELSYWLLFFLGILILILVTINLKKNNYQS